MSARFSLLLVLLCPALAFAQPATTVVSTLRTTSTASTSLRVGCTSVGTCTGGIVSGPVDTSQIVLGGGGMAIASNVPSVTAMTLYNNAGTLMWNGVALAAGSSVSGTLNKIPVFTGASSLGDSIMTQSGTTITVANTLSATTVSATTLTGTLSTASQPNVTTLAGLTTAGALATVGTITSGTWSGTIITVAKGGTGVSLSATGGTSQFLRQNTVGGNISVVRPAVADLSDGTNVAMLNATGTINFASAQMVWNGGVTISSSSSLPQLGLVNTFTAFGNHTWSAGGAGSNALAVRNTTAGAANMSTLFLGNDADAANFFIQSFSSTFTSAGPSVAAGAIVAAENAGGLSMAATHASGTLRFYTGGGAQRWGVNAAGDFTIGSSGRLHASNGTPSITSGAGSSPQIAGIDSAFVVTIGTSPTAPLIVAFGHTWSGAPVCVANTSVSGTAASAASSSTTSVTVFGTFTAGTLISVLCHGF